MDEYVKISLEYDNFIGPGRHDKCADHVDKLSRTLSILLKKHQKQKQGQELE